MATIASMLGDKAQKVRREFGAPTSVPQGDAAKAMARVAAACKQEIDWKGYAEACLTHDEVLGKISLHQ